MIKIARRSECICVIQIICQTVQRSCSVYQFTHRFSKEKGPMRISTHRAVGSRYSFCKSWRKARIEASTSAPGLSSVSATWRSGTAVMCFNSSRKTERSVSSRFFSCDNRRPLRRRRWSCCSVERGFPMSPAARGCPKTAQCEAVVFYRCVQPPSECPLIFLFASKISLLSKSPMV